MTYREAEGPTALEVAAEGPGLRYRLGGYRRSWVGPFVGMLVLLGLIVVPTILMMEERWLLTAGLYGVAFAAVPLAKAWTRAYGELARLRRSIEGLPFPVVGVEAWLDPAGPGFGELELELATQHSLAEKLVSRVVPVISARWAKTTLELRAQWTGTPTDVDVLRHLLFDLLAKHHAELGLVRVCCRAPELPRVLE